MHGATATESTVGATPSTFSALRHPNYRLFWAAQGVSVVGMTMEFVAIGWLVYQLTGSAFVLGITGLMQTLPRIALSLIGGVTADRIDMRKLLIGVQAIVAALYILLATLVVLQVVQVWHVWVLTFILGALRAFDNPSRQAILPQLVVKEDIPSAVALGNLAWEVPRLVGPAIAGVLISQIGLGSTFYIASIGFIVSMFLYGLMRIHRVEGTRRRAGFLHEMGAGLDYIRQHEVFASFMGLVFFSSIFGMSFQLMMPVFARDILDVGSEGYGFMQAALGAGAIIGSLLAARVAQGKRRALIALSDTAIFGLLIVAFALSQSFPVSIGLMVLIGLTNAFYMILMSTMLQILVPDDFRGRVMGLWSMTFSLPALGGTLVGWIASYVGVPLSVSLGGVLVTAMAGAVMVFRPEVRSVD